MQIRIAKMDKEVELDFEALPDAAKSYIIAYGLKQSLNDSIASAKTKAEMEALLDKRILAIMGGTVGIRTIRETISEMEKVSRELAKKHFKSKGLKGEKLNAAVDQLWNHPKIAEAAQAEIVRRNAAKLAEKAQIAELAALLD